MVTMITTLGTTRSHAEVLPEPRRECSRRTSTLVERMRFMREILSTMHATPLPDADYHRLANAVLSAIEAQIDRWLQDDVIDIDASRTGGLLELSFPDRSKLIINTQAPLQEIWLAARSGGYHFKYVDGVWRDTRDSSELAERLRVCATAQAGVALAFEI